MKADHLIAPGKKALEVLTEPPSSVVLTNDFNFGILISFQFPNRVSREITMGNPCFFHGEEGIKPSTVTIPPISEVFAELPLAKLEACIIIDTA